MIVCRSATVHSRRAPGERLINTSSNFETVALGTPSPKQQFASIGTLRDWRDGSKTASASRESFPALRALVRDYSGVASHP